MSLQNGIPDCTITSTCPECGKEWSRESYLDTPIGIQGLTLCGECDTGETIVGNNKTWQIE